MHFKGIKEDVIHDYIFIFNGELCGVKIKESGRIGAEKIFNFIKRFDQKGMQTALPKGVEIINKRSSYIKAMNIIIADKEKVYFSTLFNEDPDYFQMHLKQNETSLIICSEPYNGDTGWQKIKNNSNGVYKC